MSAQPIPDLDIVEAVYARELWRVIALVRP